MTAMLTSVNIPAEILPILSPKLSRPMDNPARTTVKLSHDRNVRLWVRDLQSVYNYQEYLSLGSLSPCKGQDPSICLEDPMQVPK
jgi:hypothetical protein